MSWADAISDPGFAEFFTVLAIVLVCLLPPFAMWLAKVWDTWRTERRRNRPWRPTKYVKP